MDFFSKEASYVYRDFVEGKVIRDLHGGRIAGHFEREKTMVSLEELYYWPQLGNDVTTVVKSCPVCQVAKGSSEFGLVYTFARSKRYLGRPTWISCWDSLTHK